MLEYVGCDNKQSKPWSRKSISITYPMKLHSNFKLDFFVTKWMWQTRSSEPSAVLEIRNWSVANLKRYKKNNQVQCGISQIFWSLQTPWFSAPRETSATSSRALLVTPSWYDPSQKWLKIPLNHWTVDIYIYNHPSNHTSTAYELVHTLMLLCPFWFLLKCN